MVNDHDLTRHGCSPCCGHYDEIVELHHLRKAAAALRDQKAVLLAQVAELHAEIARLTKGTPT